MKKQKKLHSFIEELVLALCTIIMLVPIYYLVLGAFKDRKDIIKYPLLLTRAVHARKLPLRYQQDEILAGAGKHGHHHARVAGHRHHLRVAGRLCHRPDPQQAFPRLLQRARHADGHPVHRLPAPADRPGHAPWHLRLQRGLFAGFMQSLPRELEEAAYIDGCTTLGVYSRVFLPLLTPVTATCAIRCGVGIWNDYLVCRSLLNENKNPTLMVGINGFFGARAMEFGYAFAGIILVSLPMIILFLCLQKYFIKGIAAGAVKG